MLRHRISLVRQRTKVKNRVHHLLEKNGVKTGRLGYSDIFGKRREGTPPPARAA